jgi:hypothetical protein
MCTIFISRGEDTVIAMNFDNNGMKFSLDTTHPGWFVVHVDGGRGKYPSFGVSRDGISFNNLLVESNGKGLYRRPSTKVTHTTKLISDILNGSLPLESLNDYLARMEVVNTPDWSCHNLISDAHANVWVVEPGRGTIYSPADESPFVVMTNVSVVEGATCPRSEITTRMLAEQVTMTVARAFEILQAAAQTEGDWITDFSMVYSKASGKVTYCYRHHFDRVEEYIFP